MKREFLTMVVALICTASSLTAAGEFDLQNAKANAREHLNKQIKVLEEAKECVEKSTNKAEFIACKEKAKIDLKAAKKSK